MRLDSVYPPATSDPGLSAFYLAGETALVDQLIGQTGLSQSERADITRRSVAMAKNLREQTGSIGFVDALMQEYGLSSADGIALMRLAEALIRTPDHTTACHLVRDKFMNRSWGEHFGNSPSFMVNGATLGLQFASQWVQWTGGAKANTLLARLGDRVFLAAMNRAMALIGEHFVLGNDIEAACAKARHLESEGYGFSYDMLGEAALTDRDAEHYFCAYAQAVRHLVSIAGNYTSAALRPSISIKLSALHPRYEYPQAALCVPPLVSKLITLALIAKGGGIGITIDAEEADRLEISLNVLEAVLMAPELSGWDGLGFVVQAYQRRAMPVIEYLIQLASSTQRRLNVRLVKGAYWDMELKRAQELGLPSYPVFTRKDYTDVSYLACAQKMLGAPTQIYSQFATHNAQTALAVDYIAKKAGVSFEFQRLHGMGERLHAALMDQGGIPSRIYAPVGQHRDLLPYLVRRLLENGANSSFVNQLTDNKTDIQSLVRDPIESAQSLTPDGGYVVPEPQNAFGMTRATARGGDWTQAKEAEAFQALLDKVPSYVASSIIGGKGVRGPAAIIRAPFNQGIEIGQAFYAGPKAIDTAMGLAQKADWEKGRGRTEACTCLRKAADLLEARQDEFIQLCVWEAGKTIADSIAEIREAVDFCRYYADQAEALDHKNRAPLGTVACISPWNFPLAIFIGQIVAALAAGNTVIAKPAEQTPLIAHRAVKLLHEAGIPVDALHLVIGDGAMLGNYLSAHASIQGICFTGSTRTAKTIASQLADTDRALIPFIAETGGVNAMIIDSTALMEQAVSDVIASAFHSAGQRCSSCRLVCIQDDMADAFIEMLSGAMDKLVIASPVGRQCDIGPVIDNGAKTMITTYVEKMRNKFKLLGETPMPKDGEVGHFVAPIAFEVSAVADVQREIFGPVLHVVRYASNGLDALVDQINSLGYGLTLGLHTRIDNRVNEIAAKAHIGNLYVNRNQIGAAVGVQPFGGEGLSGTGPKAGGPHYLRRLTRPVAARHSALTPSAKASKADNAPVVKTEALSQAQDAALRWDQMRRDVPLLALFKAVKVQHPLRAVAYQEAVEAYIRTFKLSIDLPGPTGETNKLSMHGRGVMVCMGAESPDILDRQIAKSLAAGNAVLVLCTDEHRPNFAWLSKVLCAYGAPKGLVASLPPESIYGLLNADIGAVITDRPDRREIACALARRDGAILPVLSATDDIELYARERILTINTTAAGGNAALLARV